ncbi:zinc finger AN1 domain-containing stress-associated protein 12 [Carica papaya]|uniref:zinc finger AN1 domain-containing stress-associated protein 12 n=1 Tax=Carica papaya TaxID=3649 RepID=UPI000B8CAEC3|nr:zinc finger AN1 domain-containing stress-associated protein 12 [Carica papaya]
MGGGTEAFPDLGDHCQHPDCHQLDFLPFHCDGCKKVFCLEHRSYKSHECPKSEHNSRRVVICGICSTSLETTGFDEDSARLMVERHKKSMDCDPSKKKKVVCPVRRCKEVLTFSNTSTCKVCHLKVCLKHRFPAEHSCNQALKATVMAGNGRWNDKFLVALGLRNGKDCGGRPTSPTSTSKHSVKAC